MSQNLLLLTLVGHLTVPQQSTVAITSALGGGLATHSWECGRVTTQGKIKWVVLKERGRSENSHSFHSEPPEGFSGRPWAPDCSKSGFMHLSRFSPHDCHTLAVWPQPQGPYCMHAHEKRVKIYRGRLLRMFCCFCSASKLHLALCDPIDCSMPGFPGLHSLPEFA